MFLPAEAFGNAPRDSVSFKMVYRWDVDDSLDMTHLDNQSVLDALEDYLSGSPQIDSVTIVSYASPEGGTTHNRKLSLGRARHFRDFIIALAPEDMGLTQEKFRIASSGENWEGLAEAVEKEYWRHDRERVLSILRAENVGPDTKKWRLQQLDGGYTYNFLLRKFMGELRYAASVIFYENKITGGAFLEEPAPVAEQQPAAIEQQLLAEKQPEAQPVEKSPEAQQAEKLVEDQLPVAEEMPLAEEPTVKEMPLAEEQLPAVMEQPLIEELPAKKKAARKDDWGGIFSKAYGANLSTNLISDLLLLPNFRAEFSLADRLSIAVGIASSWWKHEPTWFWEYYGGDVLVNWWFGKAAKAKPLSGHHLGAYAQVMTYDYLVAGRGIMGCTPGGNIFDSAQFSAGLEYGYTLPIARRLSLDFGIGAGYMGGKYYEYHREDEHYVWTATKERRWLGPTRVRAALVVQLGSENVNADRRRKGGSR